MLFRSNLRAVQGKWEKFVATQVNGGVDPVTNVARGGAVVITNQSDGTSRVIGAGDIQGPAEPLPNHVAALKADPTLAAKFDQQYGAGSAARYLKAK